MTTDIVWRSDTRWKQINHTDASKTSFYCRIRRFCPSYALQYISLSFIYTRPECINTNIYRSPSQRKQIFRAYIKFRFWLKIRKMKTRSVSSIFMMMLLFSACVIFKPCQGLTAGAQNWTPGGKVVRTKAHLIFSPF